MNAPIEPRHWDQVGQIGERGIIATHAQTLANLEAARADLAEIDRIAVEESWSSGSFCEEINKVAAIAAPYRASDPVAEALKAVLTAWYGVPVGTAGNFPDALAELKSRLPLGGAK